MCRRVPPAATRERAPRWPPHRPVRLRRLLRGRLLRRLTTCGALCTCGGWTGACCCGGSSRRGASDALCGRAAFPRCGRAARSTSPRSSSSEDAPGDCRCTLGARAAATRHPTRARAAPTTQPARLHLAEPDACGLSAPAAAMRAADPQRRCVDAGETLLSRAAETTSRFTWRLRTARPRRRAGSATWSSSWAWRLKRRVAAPPPPPFPGRELTALAAALQAASGAPDKSVWRTGAHEFNSETSDGTWGFSQVSARRRAKAGRPNPPWASAARLAARRTRLTRHASRCARTAHGSSV